jgi:hypothetical protein
MLNPQPAVEYVAGLVEVTAAELAKYDGPTPPVRRHDHHCPAGPNLLADPMLNVFANSEAFLFCNYDRPKALCHPSRHDGNQSPSLDRCRNGCANIARTDEHARQIEIAVADLRVQTESPLLPKPLADRLRQKVEHLTQLAAEHRTSHITLNQETS